MLDGATPRWDDIATMARLAEDIGFDSLWFPDHLMVHFDAGTFGAWDCWSLLAGIAAITQRVELGPAVSCMSFRNPALLAKMADTVDEISGGRLILGLGAGWHGPEYRDFGFPFDHLVSRFEEGIQIIRGLLREGHVDFDGVYHQARDCELRPRGPRRQGPPIMVGTLGPRMLRIMALYADMWTTAWVHPNDLPEQLAAVDAACADVGRDPATLERTASIAFDLPGTEARAFSGNPGQATGSPEELAEIIRAFAGLGITHLTVCLSPNTPHGIEAFAPVLQLLDAG
jgi:alkanesulfonate monooxygenase SsuD/methylene tetrahydromethanopterin reductase-like flavin-dependent oxidoreductase (luciferase family)